MNICSKTARSDVTYDLRKLSHLWIFQRIPAAIDDAPNIGRKPNNAEIKLTPITQNVRRVVNLASARQRAVRPASGSIKRSA
uniref:Neur_chan_LBD domain-containing protein n=1 Tax=Steinernema glaseri TaxID=37863 RepID=A0A1I7YNI0_9BILA